jgi:hypothetical protein
MKVWSSPNAATLSEEECLEGLGLEAKGERRIVETMKLMGKIEKRAYENRERDCHYDPKEVQKVGEEEASPPGIY